MRANGRTEQGQLAGGQMCFLIVRSAEQLEKTDRGKHSQEGRILGQRAKPRRTISAHERNAESQKADARQKERLVLLFSGQLPP